MGWTIGVDIGGTFTDLVAIEGASGARITRKVLTTPRDPLTGVLAALEAFEQASGTRIAAADAVIHATTLATNTLLERKGAQAALVTTRGFRDILETGREDRYEIYDLQIELQPPLIERDRRIGVAERVGARGEVLQPLDVVELEAALRPLPADIDSIAVCFLHAYANPAHERAARDVITRVRPGIAVSLSSEVAPIMREYERFVATAINAYIRPQVGDYLARLAGALERRGFTGFIGIMKSDGGMCTPREASELPARILESGPAAGILAAAQTATRRGEALAVAFDMGGTTAKACLVIDGEPVITDELEVARLARFTKHSGLPLRLPSLDLIEIGAGGGSIASISELGLLQVGPASAASDPGPACYGRGGEQPTVTDADLVLGYLNPAYFAGGSITLDFRAAETALRREILARAGSDDLTTAAWGIADLVNENMAREIRLHCVEHGIDPAAATLIATGGAGPLHAGQLMAKLGARRLLCPPDVGVASAVGLLLAPRSVEKTVTDVVLLEEVGAEGIRRHLDALKAELLAATTDLGAGLEESYVLHMRLRGQAYELRVELPTTLTTEAVAGAFAAEHAKRFGRPPPAGAIEIVNWSATLTQPSRLPASAPTGVASVAPARRGVREAYFGPAHGWLATPVLGRAMLVEGEVLHGPLLIEEEGSTIVVAPGQRAQRDPWGNLCIEASAHA